MIGIKNWKPEIDVTSIICVEHHNETDDLFVLLEGECTLVYADEEDGGLAFHGVKMERGKVYNTVRSLWHNTVTQKGVKLVLIEDPKAGASNSDVRTLTGEEPATLRAVVTSARNG